MHTHPIDLDLPFNMGKVKALIEHQPLDAENILLIVHVEHIPKVFKMFIPKEMLKEPIKRPIKRSFIRQWCRQGLEWADEPATGGSHAE